MLALLIKFTYPVVALWLLLSGLGLPFPEDVPLLIAGAMCSKEATDALSQAFPDQASHIGSVPPLSLWVMVPLCLGCIMGADAMLYYFGRRYGEHVSRLPLLRRVLTPKRMARAHAKFHGHTGKTLFVARFLPGLRTPIFFTAGTFRIPFWKMLVFDGGAAVLSVPTLVILGWAFADNFDVVRRYVKDAQIGVVVGIVVLIVAAIVFGRWRHKRRLAREAAEMAQEP